MSDKKTRVIICIAVGVLIVVLGATFSVINLMNKEKENIQDRQDEVKEKYHAFKVEADKFADARKKYQTKVVESLYVESVEEEYKKWIEELMAYQQVVDKILAQTKPVGDLCIEKKYPDQTVMANCKAYMINHETVMNYFVKDVEEFNQFMEKYHKDYKGDKAKYPLYDIEEKYHYIDINDDGNYIGKDK